MTATARDDWAVLSKITNAQATTSFSVSGTLFGDGVRIEMTGKPPKDAWSSKCTDPLA